MFDFLKTTPSTCDDLDGKTFKTQYQRAPKAELLDVRTAGEFANGTLPGALNLDLTKGQFQAALKTLDKDKNYFIFCRSGNRSGLACILMAEQGFKAYNLAGGIGAWPGSKVK